MVDIMCIVLAIGFGAVLYNFAKVSPWLLYRIADVLNLLQIKADKNPFHVVNLSPPHEIIEISPTCCCTLHMELFQ
jgi:hypothetical protein